MDDISAIITGLDGFSIALGLVSGFVFAMLTYRFYGKNFRNTLEQLSEEMKSSFKSLSSEALTSNQKEFLSLADRELDKKTEQHSTELESKKELIDTQLQQMTDTLNTVPTELDKNQKNVSEVIEKSAKNLEASNTVHLTQLQERSDTQTKEHLSKLDEKELLINRRLGEMDEKLGKVQELIGEFEKARETKLGALDDQLKNLTTTTSSLQTALADNRARGQWGERIADDILRLLGFVEGVNYDKQATTDEGTRPDFTFHLPNHLTLNMDAKFPLDNYMRYFEAETESEKRSFSDKFLRDVNSRVAEIQKRDYIGAETLDCVLVFIPNEQVYRFIHEQDHSIIDSALRQKVILCSPLTLYIVLAVIRQASQNFNVAEKSREIILLVNEVRGEWKKYTDQMDKLERSFQRVHNDLDSLTGTRTRQLDRKFDRIDTMIDSNELETRVDVRAPQLPLEAT